MKDLRVRVLASGPVDARQRGLALAPRYGMDPDRVVDAVEVPGSRSRRSRSAIWEVDVRGGPAITESELRLLDGNR